MANRIRMARRIFCRFLVAATLFLVLAILAQTNGSAFEANSPAGNSGSRESIVTADGRTRTYVLHVPKGYTANKSYPLVLLFHGGYGAGAQILAMTGFGAKADREGFFVVAPDGIDRHWNDGRGTVNAAIDDVGFVRQLVDNIESRFRIDRKRIYATGISNGGEFTERLGCELSDKLAAIAPVAGPINVNTLASCKPRPIAVVGIQGAADPLTPIGGGEGGGGYALAKTGLVASAAQTMHLWAEANNCHLTPNVKHIAPTINDGTSVDEYSFSGCTADSNVIYYVVQGMGHVWPPVRGIGKGAFLTKITGPTSGNINATDVFWDFFNAHQR